MIKIIYGFLLLLPVFAQALEPLVDEVLGDVTGAEGVTIEMDNLDLSYGWVIHDSDGATGGGTGDNFTQYQRDGHYGFADVIIKASNLRVDMDTGGNGSQAVAVLRASFDIDDDGMDLGTLVFVPNFTVATGFTSSGVVEVADMDIERLEASTMVVRMELGAGASNLLEIESGVLEFWEGHLRIYDKDGDQGSTQGTVGFDFALGADWDDDTGDALIAGGDITPLYDNAINLAGLTVNVTPAGVEITTPGMSGVSAVLRNGYLGDPLQSLGVIRMSATLPQIRMTVYGVNNL